MTKTPEELAFDYALNILETRILDSIEREEARLGFLAGYKAAKDQLFEETGFRLKLFKDEADAKAAYQEALEEDESDKAYQQGLKDGAPQWISVKDRLPEEDVTVLAFVNYSVGDAELRLVTSAAYRGKLWLCGRDIYSEGFVTHWMPLPKPPEE